MDGGQAGNELTTQRKLRWIALLYFAEGFPFGIVLDNLPLYLRTQGVPLGEIGLMSLLRAPWSAKVLWAPLVDRYFERRQWITAALTVMGVALMVVPWLPPMPVGLLLTGVLLVFTTMAATQDVAIDAYTIELVAPGEEGMANGVRVSAYRAALIVAGGMLVAVVRFAGWHGTFTTAGLILFGLALATRALPTVNRRPQAFRDWWRVFSAWLGRPGAPALFAFVLTYKLGDATIGPMVKPFWVDRGLTLEEIALVSTTIGVGASVVGSIVGGIFTSRRGIFTSLWVLGLVHASANLCYATAAWLDVGRPGIYAASLAESFTGGLGTAAFLSFLMNICEKEQAATQYALLSALFSLSGALAGSLSGHGVERLGYGNYFALTFVAALPCYALLPWVRGWIRERATT